MPLGGRSLVLNTMPPDGSDEQLISAESSVRLPAVTSPKAASKSDRDIRLLYQGSPLRPDVRPAIPRRTVGSGDMSRLMKDLPQDDGTAWAQLTGRIDDLQRQLAASDGRSTAILSRLEERLTKAQMREAAAMQHEGHGMKLMAVTMRSSGDMKPGQYVKGSTLKVEGQLSSLDARLHQLQSMMHQDVRQLSDTITKGQMAASNRIRVLEVQVEQMLASTGQQVKKDIAQAIAQERGVSAADDQVMIMGDQTSQQTQNAAKLIEARFSQLAARLEASEAARARLEEQVATLQLQQQGGPQAADIAPMGNHKLEELVRSLLGRIAVLEAQASPTTAGPPAAVPAVQVAAAAPGVKEQVQVDSTSDAAHVADPQVTALKPDPAEAAPKAVQQAAVETAAQASKGDTEVQAPDNVPQESKQSVVTSADVVESMVPIGEAGLAAGGQTAGGKAEGAASVVIAAETAGAAEANVAEVAGTQKGVPAGNGLVQSQQVEGEEEEEEEDEGEDEEDEGEEEEGEEEEEDTMAQQQQQQQQQQSAAHAVAASAEKEEEEEGEDEGEDEEEEEEGEDDEEDDEEEEQVVQQLQQQQQQQQSAAHAVAASAEKEEEEEGEDEGEDEEEEEEGEDDEEDDEKEEQVVQQLQQQQQQQQQLHQQQEQRPAAHVVAAPAKGEEEEEEGEDEGDEGEEEEEEGEEEEDDEEEESSVVTQKK